MNRQCGSCEQPFTPKTKRAQFCSNTCRSRAARQRKSAAESVAADASAGRAEHQLVKAVRAELEKAEATETFSGQLALQLARKLVNPDERAATALSKELRTVMDAALAGTTPPPDGDHQAPAGPAEVEDDVTRARRAREQKLSAAAGRA